MTSRVNFARRRRLFILVAFGVHFRDCLHLSKNIRSSNITLQDIAVERKPWELVFGVSFLFNRCGRWLESGYYIKLGTVEYMDSQFCEVILVASRAAIRIWQNFFVDVSPRGQSHLWGFGARALKERSRANDRFLFWR